MIARSQRRPMLLETRGLRPVDRTPSALSRSATGNYLALIGKIAIDELRPGRLAGTAICVTVGGMVAGTLHMAFIALTELSASISPFRFVETGAFTWLFATTSLWLAKLLVLPAALGTWRAMCRRDRLERLLSRRSVSSCRRVPMTVRPRLAS